ncbi:MAG: SDR family NAD(P)-dependent oxidoreductase [Anaerovoracaceae bacterium]|nr:SDR family NAD(P)-dependent oxidoreductase [Anaerovoracaceae bacterium]
MSGRFEGKAAVVVGGAGGIGNAIVTALLADGAKVAVGDINEDRLKEMELEFQGALIGIKTDAISYDDHKNLVEKALETFGKLDLAFNVAGGSKMGLIDTGSVENWEWTIDLCLKGTYLGLKHQIAAMKVCGGGSIVNISSANAITPMWGDSAYNAAKKGVISLTETAMLENTEYNIRCNAVIPGQIDTKMTRGWREVSEINDEYMRRIPMKRAGTPDEVANAALFLASDDASYITGTTLIVDGGRIAAGYPNIAPYLQKHPDLWEV